ncbi:transposase [Streptomyces sp. NPDC021098]|uniref:transposase n=1 Tax=unclassified Streptomyces TaxID=2593676 RepID=UPI0037A45089
MNGTVPPAVRELWAVVDRLAPRDEAAWEARPALRRGRLVSRARAAQLRTTLAHLERAVGRPEMPEGAAGSVRILLGPEGADAFLELAAAGELRAPGTGRSGELSWSSVAALRDCLAILGEETGVEMLLPQVWRPQAKPPVTPAQAAALYRRMADMAASAPLDALLARTLAVVGVALDSGMPSGDMVARRLEHVDLDAGLLRAEWHRQNASHLPVVEDTVRLREGTVVALERWLTFRRELVDRLEGADPGALWVTTRPASRDFADGRSELYPAGLPLRQWGFGAAYRSGVGRLNEAMASRWDGDGPWEPLPLKFEQLVRAVEAERVRAWVPVSDAVWARVEPLFPDRSVRGQGGRAWRDHRQVLDAIGWRYQTRGAWARLPKGLGEPSAAAARLRRWVEDGTWARVCVVLREELGAGGAGWAELAARSVGPEPSPSG